jgi:hypothetical protein
MSAKFISIGFNWSGPAKTVELEAVFNPALDWLRLSAANYILYTSTDMATWSKRIHAVVGDKTSFLMFEIPHIETNDGRVTDVAWKWLSKKRD